MSKLLNELEEAIDNDFDFISAFQPHFETTRNMNNFPPYDIIDYDDYVNIEVAVSGCTRDNLCVSVENNTLQVKGNLGREHDHEESSRKYIHKGIEKRNFELTFSLDRNQVVNKVKLLDNGLLQITVDRLKPKHDSRSIPIE